MQEALEMRAALTVQSIVRGFLHRTKDSVLEKKNHAAQIIQTAWKKHRNRCHIQKVREIIALSSISRVVLRYRDKLEIRKTFYKINQLEPLLMFMPTVCNEPEIYKAKTQRELKKTKKRPSSVMSMTLSKRSGTSKSKKKSSTSPKKASQKKPKSRSNANRSSGGGGIKPQVSVLDQPMLNNSPYNWKKGPQKKKKILIDLPPPWHGKDAKRISQSQMDDMLYDQKNDLKWVLSDISPLFLRAARNELDQRDELYEKNEKYRNRIVQKPFIEIKLRTKTSFKASNPLCITFIQSTGMYAMATSSDFIICKTNNFIDDDILAQGHFDVEFPLLDVDVSPSTGFFIGLDNQWTIREFSKGKTIMDYHLKPPNTIPSAKKYISIDTFGFLWVNLLPQQGDILGFDTLTLSPTVKVSYSSFTNLYTFAKSNISFYPITYKTPLGFAGIFTEREELVLFPPDFKIDRHLYNKNLKKVPIFKQQDHRLFVWSEDAMVFGYELNSGVSHMILIGSFQLDSTPVDICATLEPDLIYVACEDNTLRVFLGSAVEYKIRLPNSKMTPKEEDFAEIMLGPQTFTHSCPIYSETVRHRFSSPIAKISAFSLTPTLALLSVAFTNGSLYSLWVFNNQQPVKCCEYHLLHKPTTIESQAAIVSQYKVENAKMVKRRHEFTETFNFLHQYDVFANKGQIQNIFQPKKTETFDITNVVKNITLDSMFPFLPEKEEGKFSCYEVFHYLKRSGILPTKVSSFYHFLKVLAPKEDLKESALNAQDPTQELNQGIKSGRNDNNAFEPLFNIMLPVNSKGYWNSIVNYRLDKEKITDIARKMDPLTLLREQLAQFTLSDLKAKDSVQRKSAAVAMTRKLLSETERNELTKMQDRLSALELLVKFEIMSRTQKVVDASFYENLMNKILPVPAIDIYKPPDSNDVKSVKFTVKPNRNPLLDRRVHKSIYHTLSVEDKFGNTQQPLHAIYIPREKYTPVVKTHFELVRRVSGAMKRVSSDVFGAHEPGIHLNGKNIDTRVVIALTEDIKVLPLSHYLNIHSFLGGNSRLILAARKICSNVLTILYQLHKAGLILRTLYPDNIMLNSQTEQITIGNIYDCQTISGNNLPLPEPFNDINNPFLPPEYFTSDPLQFTRGFDVWQFGILLLYILTGYLPPSYGSEMKKNEGCKDGFFYDWLQGAPLVSNTSNQVVGSHGECFLQTSLSPDIPASVLNLEYYTLLPYKCAKNKNYDESKAFLDIIACCLQIDPQKRPSVETLLRTYPFSQNNQIGDILDQYMKNPNERIYVNEFFKPSFDNLSINNFEFAIGIASALIYKDEMAPEDEMYSFPIDSQSLEKVAHALFSIHFLDILVKFVLERIEKEIVPSNMKTFRDETFSKLVHFFKRFIASVDRGQGILNPFINEVILSLFATFTGNPYLRYSSSELQDNQVNRLRNASTGSAALYVFTNSQLRSTVDYALKSFFILSGISRTDEHSDLYFKNFMSFGESVLAFANAITHGIEKQRENSLFNMEQLWDDGQSPHIVRLFIDYRVPQMILHCLSTSSSKEDSLMFADKILSVARLKTFDPTYALVQFSFTQPTMFLHLASFIQLYNGDHPMMTAALNIIRRVFFGDSPAMVAVIVASDILFTLADYGRIPQVHDLLNEAINFSSRFILQLMVSNAQLSKQLDLIGVRFLNTPFDIESLRNPKGLQSCFETAKRVAASLFICLSDNTNELKKKIPPLYDSAEFIIKAFQIALAECDIACKQLEIAVQQNSKFDLKGSLYQKAKAVAKTTDFCQKQATITGLCEALLHLFRCICFFWRDPIKVSQMEPEFQLNKNLFEYILQMLPQDLPECKCIAHLSFIVHNCIQEMTLHCIIDLPDTSPIHEIISSLTVSNIFLKILNRDVSYIRKCAEKEVTEMQLNDRYINDRKIRLRLFETIVCDHQLASTQPLIEFVITQMLYDQTQFVGGTWSKNYLFPIRSEAVVMIIKVLNQHAKNDIASRKVADELMAFKFIEKEKELNGNDIDQVFSPSSNQLLKAVVHNEQFFDASTVRIAKDQLDQLSLRYTKDWISSSTQSSYDVGPGRAGTPLKDPYSNGSQLHNFSPIKSIGKTKLGLKHLASIKKVIKSTASSSRKPDPAIISPPKRNPSVDIVLKRNTR